MEADTLIQISNRIKECRREKSITLQQLADRANVSKGLISQIENSRTVPSLFVLIEIVKSLDIDLDDFFKDIHTKTKELPVLVKRAGEYESFEKEHAIGFHYQRVFSKVINPSTIDIVLLELDVNASRPVVVTDGYEYKYIILGQVTYLFNDSELITLNEGDSILFDGRAPHTTKNTGNQKAVLLTVYFFEEKK
jgi:transcriptional regulator with XRE-family HTH domain